MVILIEPNQALRIFWSKMELLAHIVCGKHLKDLEALDINTKGNTESYYPDA